MLEDIPNDSAAALLLMRLLRLDYEELICRRAITFLISDGVFPTNDGQVIRVPIPPLTEERRREYVKLVRQKAEEARVAIRNVRRDEMHRIDQMQKKGEVAEDDSKRGTARLQKITEAQIERVDA